MAHIVSSSRWIAIKLNTAPEAADSIANHLHEQGAAGLVLEDEDPSQQRITAYFPKSRQDEVLEALQGHLAILGECFPGLRAPSISVESVEETNWAVAWKDAFTNIPVGNRLMVTPPWLQPDPGGRELIIIEPADAFGTGTHETTQGCLVLLEEAVERLPDRRPDVLDVGCGSAILGIAARKLGAGVVRCVDSDPVAVASAQENLRLNGLEGQVELSCTDLVEISESADIVLANLDARTLEANCSRLKILTKKFLIIAGVTTPDWSRVKELFLKTGLTGIREIVGAEWACGMFAPLGSTCDEVTSSA